MASYQVLVPPSGERADARVIRDGFSLFGLLLPLPWLLVRGLWLASAGVFAAYLIAGLVAEQFGLDALPLSVYVLVALWVAFEGGHLRARKLEKRGWTLERVIEARRLSDAEAIYYSEIPDQDMPAPKLPRLADRTPSVHAGGIMALGLTDPRGGR